MEFLSNPRMLDTSLPSFLRCSNQLVRRRRLEVDIETVLQRCNSCNDSEQPLLYQHISRDGRF